MTSDAISSEDWDRVHELAVDLVNASDDEDETARQRLFECLSGLTLKYGELPSIVATQADYVNDPLESEALFLRAFDLAQSRGDRSNIREISLSLASLYASTLRRPSDATRWLEVAHAYMDPDNEMDRSEYHDIEAAIARLKGDQE
jgi:hypothetical protein